MYFDGMGQFEVTNMPTINEADCVACGACVDVCPSSAITVGDIAVINPSAFTDCGACMDECPAGAIE